MTFYSVADVLRHKGLRIAFVGGAMVTLPSCAGTPPVADIPHCERYVPASMREPVEGVDIPQPRSHADGHQDARPWMDGYLGQTGALDKANDKTAGVDHIYRTCLDEHRGQLKRATAPWWKRIF